MDKTTQNINKYRKVLIKTTFKSSIKNYFFRPNKNLGTVSIILSVNILYRISSRQTVPVFAYIKGRFFV